MTKATTRVPRRAGSDGHGERGAILILALVYIIVASVVVAALTTWASGDLNNTNNFTAARNMDYSLSSAVEVAINDIRYTPLVAANQTLNASPPSYCWGSGPTSTYELPGSTNNIAVWCSTLMDEANQQHDNRTVTISACLATTSATQCAATPLLQAIVEFDDYPPTGATVYTGACSTYCGEGATLVSWDWSSKDTLSPVLLNSISVANGPPQPPLVGGSTGKWTPGATATSQDNVVVTSSNSLVCSVGTGTPVVVTFVANGNCTISFNDPGNINYGPAPTVTRNITVGPLLNTITVTSSPGSPTVGGPTYTTVATATSGDSLTVSATASSSGVCTVSSGVVSFIGNGNCTLNFYDPGNTDYQSASATQGPFAVGVGIPAGLSILANASPQNGSPNNGDSVVYTYNQTMSGSSLLSGFSGSSTPVYVQLSRPNSSSSTLWQVCSTSSCSTPVNLGTIDMGDASLTSHYLTAGTTAVFNATMLMSTSSGDSVVTVSLGSLASGSVNTLSPATTQTTLTWTPSASAMGTVNSTPCSTTAVVEANSPKANF